MTPLQLVQPYNLMHLLNYIFGIVFLGIAFNGMDKKGMKMDGMKRDEKMHHGNDHSN